MSSVPICIISSSPNVISSNILPGGALSNQSQCIGGGPVRTAHLRHLHSPEFEISACFPIASENEHLSTFGLYITQHKYLMRFLLVLHWVINHDNCVFINSFFGRFNKVKSRLFFILLFHHYLLFMK